MRTSPNVKNEGHFISHLTWLR